MSRRKGRKSSFAVQKHEEVRQSPGVYPLGAFLLATFVQDLGDQMKQRAYTLLDITMPAALWPDVDRVVRFMEYVRVHIQALVPGIPPECTIELMASGTAHNSGKVPLLGLHCPDAMTTESIPNVCQAIDSLSAWAAALSPAEVERIVSETKVPTWDELCRRSF